MADPTIQPKYGAFSALTITLANLATDATLLAGRQATPVANSSLYADAELNGKITVGTTPTVNTAIYVYGYVAQNDTPTWPDQMSTTDANRSITSLGVGRGFLKLLAALNVDATTSDRAYPFACGSLADLFGMSLQAKNWGIWVVHNTGVNLKNNGADQVLEWRGFNPIIPTV